MEVEMPFLNINHVAKMLHVHPRTIKKWVEAGEFPKAVRISSNRSLWTKDMIMDWFEGKKDLKSG